MVATAGKITVAEVEHIVAAGAPPHTCAHAAAAHGIASLQHMASHRCGTWHQNLNSHASTGSLDPDEIHVPGIYVSRIYQPASFEKRIERLTLQKEPGAADGKGLGVRERIVKRAAKELKDGMCVPEASQTVLFAN